MKTFVEVFESQEKDKIIFSVIITQGKDTIVLKCKNKTIAGKLESRIFLLADNALLK